MSLTGEPDSPPAKAGLSMVDLSAGAVAMIGLLAGVLHAKRTGEGCDLDMSLHDVAISMLNYVAIWTANRDFEPQRLPDSAHQSLYPAQVFRTKDDWIVICCFKEKFWKALTESMAAPELADDPRFCSFATRYQHRQALIADLKARFLTATTEEWLSRLRGRVPCAPVNSVRQALEDEQTLARDMLVEIDHPQFGRLKETRTAVRVVGGADYRRPAPALGADNQAILGDLLGYTAEQIAELQRGGVI